MSINVPGDKPFTPPINPKGLQPEVKPEEKLVQKPAVQQPARPGIGRGPELDTHALSTRMAIIAAEAKEKELKFEDIIDRVIQETGTTNPQGAMEEASKRKQKEIEDEIIAIKENKELMDDAESWHMLEEMLLNMNEDQANGFLSLLQEAVHGFI
ncbi:MAG: hypothetical protein ABIH50_06415 [bacterium]